jgi:hypothetical protein
MLAPSHLQLESKQLHCIDVPIFFDRKIYGGGVLPVRHHTLAHGTSECTAGTESDQSSITSVENLTASPVLLLWPSYAQQQQLLRAAMEDGIALYLLSCAPCRRTRQNSC